MSSTRNGSCYPLVFWTENNGTDFRTKTKRCFMSYPLTLQCTRLLKVSLLRVSLLRDSLLRMGS